MKLSGREDLDPLDPEKTVNLNDPPRSSDESDGDLRLHLSDVEEDIEDETEEDTAETSTWTDEMEEKPIISEEDENPVPMNDIEIDETQIKEEVCVKKEVDLSMKHCNGTGVKKSDYTEDESSSSAQTVILSSESSALAPTYSGESTISGSTYSADSSSPVTTDAEPSQQDTPSHTPDQSSSPDELNHVKDDNSDPSDDKGDEMKNGPKSGMKRTQVSEVPAEEPNKKSRLNDFCDSTDNNMDIVELDDQMDNLSDDITMEDLTRTSLYSLYKNKNFKGLTKKALQELIAQKFCDMLANQGPHGEMRHQIAQLEDDYHRLNKLNVSLRKQLQDTKHIIKRLIEEREIQKKTGRVATPLRVTRSVGLQVCTTGSFYMRPKAEFKQTGNDKVIDVETFEPGTGTSGSIASHKPLKAEPPSPKSSPGKVIIERAVVPTSSLPQRKELVTPPMSAVAKPVQRPPGALMPPVSTPTGRVGLQPPRLANINLVNVTNQKKDETPQTTAGLKAARLLPPTPGVQHYIIASPVKTVPITTPPHTPVLPAPNPPEKLNTMEVIDLTEKEDKTSSTKVGVPTAHLQNGKLGAHSSRVSYLIPAAPVAAVNQPSHIKLAQVAKKTTQEIVSMQDAPPKSGKVICAVSNDQEVPIHKLQKPDDKVHVSLVKLPPLPPAPKYGIIPAPPRPYLRICKSSAGIMLSWNFGNSKIHTEIATFELFAYQERREVNVPNVWNKVGEVKALPLPMACTLTQFVEGQKYHFAVRAIDIHDRIGEFSSPGSIMLTLADQ